MRQRYLVFTSHNYNPKRDVNFIVFKRISECCAEGNNSCLKDQGSLRRFTPSSLLSFLLSLFFSSLLFRHISHRYLIAEYSDIPVCAYTLISFAAIIVNTYTPVVQVRTERDPILESESPRSHLFFP